MDKVQKELDRLNNVISSARKLIPDNVNGKSKFIRNCEAEFQFIKKLDPNNVNIVNRISSTNTTHLEALLQTVLEQYPKGLQSLLQKFKYHNSKTGLEETVIVDIVCQLNDGFGPTGMVWAKVIARNPQALHNIWRGFSESKATSLTEHARQYLNCARQHPKNFLHPEVRFHLVRGITFPLHRRLGHLGVKVDPDTVPTEANDEESDYNDSEDEELDSDYGSLSPPLVTPPESPPCSLGSPQLPINLDVTTLMVLVSELCYSGPPPKGQVFKDPSHQLMAKEEGVQSALDLLHSRMKGYRAVVCKTAWKEFETIVNTVGGEKEQERSRLLLSTENVTLVPDEVSSRANSLKPSAKVREKNIIVFGTGDHLQAITLTANNGFVRAASNQNLDFAVFIHPSRALTERAVILPATPCSVI